MSSTSIYIYIYTYLYPPVCMYVCCMYVCMYVCVCMCVHMYVCMDACMYVCMYVLIYCLPRCCTQWTHHAHSVPSLRKQRRSFLLPKGPSTIIVGIWAPKGLGFRESIYYSITWTLWVYHQVRHPETVRKPFWCC